MKIGIDVSPMFYQRGGIGTYTLHLTDHLIQLNSSHQFFLYSTRRESPDPPENFSFLNQSNVNLIIANKWMTPCKIWKAKLDIVHGPNFRLPGRGKKGNVLTIHDLALFKYPSFGKKKIGSRFSFERTRNRALMADRVIADSQNTLEDIERFIGVPKEKIRVIYMGIDPFYTRHDHQELFIKVKDKYGLKKEQYVLFTGTLEPRKNVKTLIQAFARNREVRKTHNLVLAGGGGWDNQEIQDMILNEELRDEVCITGYLPREELRILYSRASCFVFPSLYEGFGMPPLEAMACGVPVICSNSSSLPEVIGNAGIMVNPHDIEGFSSAIERVLRDEALRKSLIDKGYGRVKHFSWKETAQKTLQVYEEIYRQ